MFPPETGCPHNYSLTPSDMQKLSKADILVVNGLGIEEFATEVIKKANPNIKIINSSHGIENLITSIFDHLDNSDPLNTNSGSHNHKGYNPHIFASPAMASKMIKNICLELSLSIKTESPKIVENYKNYVKRVDSIANEFKDLGSSVSNNRIITQHDAFDYLARDAGLFVESVVNLQAGKEVSASHMVELAAIIKRKKVAVIFGEPLYPLETIKTLAKETGIPYALLDPVSSAPDSVGEDYYLKVMQNNLSLLKEILGSK